jgi:putative membrane protein
MVEDFLDREAQEEVARAIRAAEARTTGEIVTVVARQAHTYLAFALIWPALFALIVPGPVAHFIDVVDTPEELYALQLIVFLVLELILLIPRVRMWAVPYSIKRARAGQLAREQFFARGLHLTRGRTGVLIFVSVAERYVEILADAGINEKVGNPEWVAIVESFVSRVSQGQTVVGFVRAVTAVGDILAAHFPGARTDTNELPDRLFVI